MTYISWALYVEGTTDEQYLSVVLPKLIEHLLRGADGPNANIPDTPVETFGNPKHDLEEIAKKVCEGIDAFHILFVHGDTGGRALANQIDNRTCALCDHAYRRCNFPPERCIILAPNREIEAWTLADADAIRSTFDLRANATLHGIPNRPAQVENIHDPKAAINTFLTSLINGRRRRIPKWPYARIAQDQSIDVLLQVPSFAAFIEPLKVALRGLGYPRL